MSHPLQSIYNGFGNEISQRSFAAAAARSQAATDPPSPPHPLDAAAAALAQQNQRPRTGPGSRGGSGGSGGGGGTSITDQVQVQRLGIAQERLQRAAQTEYDKEQIRQQKQAIQGDTAESIRQNRTTIQDQQVAAGEARKAHLKVTTAQQEEAGKVRAQTLADKEEARKAKAADKGNLGPAKTLADKIKEAKKKIDEGKAKAPPPDRTSWLRGYNFQGTAWLQAHGFQNRRHA
jgi:hypothetical protein